MAPLPIPCLWVIANLLSTLILNASQAWSWRIRISPQSRPAAFGSRKVGRKEPCRRLDLIAPLSSSSSQLPQPPRQPQQLGSFEPLIRQSSSSSSSASSTSTIATLRPKVRLVDWTKMCATSASTTTTTPVDFTTAWNVQKRLLQEHVQHLTSSPSASDAGAAAAFTASQSSKGDKTPLDTVILVEHAPVYTLGTGSDASFVKSLSDTSDVSMSKSTLSSSSVPIVRMDRGGEVTYHGPGQLTIYPILDLRRYKQDIHWYVRALEQVVLVALRNGCGIVTATRHDDVTGIWVDDYKVAAVGVSVKKWITQHGVAINVTPESLPNFDGIVPCGLIGRRVGCVQQFLSLSSSSASDITVAQMATHVKAALEEVFEIELVTDDGIRAE